jgi:hypothetical protein
MMGKCVSRHLGKPEVTKTSPFWYLIFLKPRYLKMKVYMDVG